MPSHFHKPPSLIPALKAVDTRFSEAGLVRSRRIKPAARPESTRFDPAGLEAHTYPAPVPRRAVNGVEWLPVPKWDSYGLWAGFSTRRGGLSSVYCPEDAPGELNLGFTADDDRKIVVCNRQLLAEAVAGDRSTPLVSLRQIHSNLVVQAASLRRGPRSTPQGRWANHR